MNRTAIYGRVSTEDQVERFGLPTQIRACREYADRNGLDVVAEITDDGISGTILDRPGFERLRRMARDREVGTVLMLDVDRLSRELSHLLILKPEIERHARLEFVTSKFEDSPSGRMFFGMRGVIAQYESELTRERTMRGRKERARSGLIVGGRVPYGYRYNDGKLVEDPDRAPIARRIFEDYEAGISMRGIAARLRESGALTWANTDRWGKSSVQRILLNETYAGVAHYGTHRREGKLLRLRDAAERIAVHVPALVSRDQWERVQTKLSANPYVGRPSLNFLLRGILFCAKCGRKMSGENSRKCRAYRCTGRDRLRVQGEVCQSRLGATTRWNRMGGARERLLKRGVSEGNPEAS
jgi:site-specific DNA recombinase